MYLKRLKSIMYYFLVDLGTIKNKTTMRMIKAITPHIMKIRDFSLVKKFPLTILAH